MLFYPALDAVNAAPDIEFCHKKRFMKMGALKHSSTTRGKRHKSIQRRISRSKARVTFSGKSLRGLDYACRQTAKGIYCRGFDGKRQEIMKAG
uniref:Uncharacterized protein n=1 Tax=Hyaloperonospora arabidopsidis (strain Emoy2) TaxID=559515 RepID=M4BM38_HYAAE